MNAPRLLKQAAAFLLCVILAATVAAPITAHAQETGKTVHVGWYESPSNMIDAQGRRSGYAYEYQQKIAADRVKDDPEKSADFTIRMDDIALGPYRAARPQAFFAHSPFSLAHALTYSISGIIIYFTSGI